MSAAAAVAAEVALRGDASHEPVQSPVTAEAVRVAAKTMAAFHGAYGAAWSGQFATGVKDDKGRD